MKHVALSTMAVVLCASLASAQPPRGERPDGFRPPNPLLMIFDGDQDGKLSKAEIADAAKSLAKLDKNENGTIEEDELPRPPRPQFGRGGDGARPGGRPGEGGPGGRGGFNFNVDDRMKEMDKNEDGFIGKDELPERFGDRMLERMDTDKDGKISKKEMEDSFARLRERFSQGRGGRPGAEGEGGRRPRRPDGEGEGGRRPRRPEGDGDGRPRRPERPEA